MAQEFYLKAQALHEEFQKRELHYLNTERKLNSSILWKKDYNLPLQEYLQRISQREKETDETYRNIMKQMEEIDRHADVLSLKLEKLGILQTSVTTATTSNWLQRLGPHTTVGLKHQTPHVQSLQSVQDVFSLSVRSVSTQTESSLHCGKCNSPVLLNNQSSHLLENFPPSSKTLSGTNSKSETIKSSNLQSDSSSLFNETQNVTQHRESVHTEHLMPANGEDVFEENSKSIEDEEKHSAQKPSFSRELNDRDNTVENEMQINEDLIPDTTQSYIPKHLESSNVSQSTVGTKNGHIETANAESHKDTFVAKSDVDSINNEFDFLESDTANKPDKIKIPENLESIKSSGINASIGLNKVPSSVEKHSGDSKSKKQEKRASHRNSKLNAADDESETSGGYSGFHSPHLSVASDSDTAYENGSPLTASAAYQALLGNTVLPKTAPKNVSDSESEDEIENALASAVQRNNVKSKSSVKKKNEMPLQQAVAKPTEKASKLTSVNKPQSKLSKNTRKVLGLDTSSGSDVEMAVRPPAGEKIDEDSDEFGFFD